MQLDEVVARAKTQMAPVTERIMGLREALTIGTPRPIIDPNPSPRVQTSMNLPILFSALGSHARLAAGLRVLDLGPKNPHTTEYLKRYQSTLVYADLLGKLEQPQHCELMQDSVASSVDQDVSAFRDKAPRLTWKFSAPTLA